MERAIAYIRVSHVRQITDGNSLETQEVQVREYMDRHGYDCVRVFVERGESAKTDDRTVLQEMLGFLKDDTSKIQVLVIPRIDRLARKVLDYANLKLRMQALGIRLESISERIEDTPVGRFTETILASAAQFDNEVRAERSKGGMIQAVTEGRWVWQAPFGYRNVRIGADGKKRGLGTIEPHPVEAELVKQCFERLACGKHSGREVHAWLNKRVHLSKTRFQVMVQNQVYLGRITAFGTTSEAKPPFTPLIEEATFYAAQANFRRKQLTARTHQRDRADFPLKGTLRCKCGRTMTANWAKGRRGGLHAHYRCVYCPRMNARKDVIEAEFARQLANFQPLPERLQVIEQALTTFTHAERRGTELARERVAEEERQVFSLQSALAQKVAAGVVPDDVALREFTRLAAQRKELTSRMLASTQSAVEVADLMRCVRKVLADLPSCWRRGSLNLQKKLQRFFFPNGIFLEDRGSFRTPDDPLLERVSGFLRGHVVSLVDQPDECSNPASTLDLHLWLSRLVDELNEPN